MWAKEWRRAATGFPLLQTSFHERHIQRKCFLASQVNYATASIALTPKKQTDLVCANPIRVGISDRYSNLKTKKSRTSLCFYHFLEKIIHTPFNHEKSTNVATFISHSLIVFFLTANIIEPCYIHCNSLAHKTQSCTKFPCPCLRSNLQ